ncbi:MAG: hypothetical protein GY810_23200 [Aureispira sp.]|nr:hypothetical protein [Aureispira sp.]
MVLGKGAYWNGWGSNYIHEMGVYHIAILNNLDKAQETLEQVPKEKRPNIPQDYINFYKEQFPDYPLLICCFSSRDIEEVSPIIVHYTPQKPNEFRLPNIEGHGELPVLGESFEGERTFFVGSSFDKTIYGKENISDYGVNNKCPHLLPFMPKYGGLVTVEPTELKNLDIVVSKKKNESKWRLFFNKNMFKN